MFKRLCFLNMILGFSLIATAQQSLSGIWKDTLRISAKQELEVVFVISKTDTAWTCVMDSPMQYVTNIPVTTFSYQSENDSLKITSKPLNMKFIGKYNSSEDVVDGLFTQGLLKRNLKLKRTTERLMFMRPQQPRKPYPYLEEEVTFKNEKENIILNGTLTIPDSLKRPAPAVILLTGSGWQDRNESLLGHKPFLVIADYLTRQGIAVLRFDDRTYQKYIQSTTIDFAQDALAAFDFLKKDPRINERQIGLCGHSEGGLIAIVAAAENQDIAFVISMAGAIIPMTEIMAYQCKAIALQQDIPEKYIDEIVDCYQAIYDKLLKDKSKQNKRFVAFTQKKCQHLSDSTKILFNVDSNYYKQLVLEYLKPWWKTGLQLNPDDYLKKITCSMFLINGAEDVQVPKISLEQVALKYPFKPIETKEYASLNHLFQHCKTCTVNEYPQIEETISEFVLKDIAHWILRQIQFR